MDSLGLTADPNNPYYQPPAGSELLLRGIGSALQGVGASGSRTLHGQLIRGGAGIAGGLTSATGEAMQAKRLDPLLRQLAIQQQAANVAQGIGVPVTAAQNVPVEGPLMESGAFGSAGAERPMGTIPAITRPPINEYELFANAPNDAARAKLALAGNPGRFINDPMPAARLDHVQAQTGSLQSQAAVDALKIVQHRAFVDAVAAHNKGIPVPEHVGAFLTDDQRLQVGLVSRATLQKQQERAMGVGPKDNGPSVGPDREALAAERGYPTYADVPQKEKAEINKEVKRRDDERIAIAAGREERLGGQFGQMLALQNQREARQEANQVRLAPSQTKMLTANRVAMSAIDDYAKGYDEFVKESRGGVLSDSFRGAIAKNKAAQRASDFVTVEGRTPAEKQFAAKYNALVGNIRSLTDEVGVLTDVDAVRILGSFDPAQDRNQVRANLAARRRTHQRVYETALEDYQALGKDVSRFVKPPEPPSALSGGPARGPTPTPAEINAAKKRLGIQ